MTDDLSSRDELVAAVLDGEASPEEVARVASDPALTARLAQFRSHATLVAEPVGPLDADVLDSLLDRALEEFDVADRPDADAAVTPLRRSSAEQARPGGLPRWVLGAAAAVIALLAVPVVLLQSAGDDEVARFESVGSALSSADDSATSAGDAAPMADGAFPATEQESTGASDGFAFESAPTSTMQPSSPGMRLADAADLPTFGDLGAWSSVRDLAQAVRDLDGDLPPTGLASDATARSELTDADLEAAADCGLGAPGTSDLQWGTATLDGDRVLVVLRGEEGAPEVIVVLDAVSCSLSSTTPFLG